MRQIVLLMGVALLAALASGVSQRAIAEPAAAIDWQAQPLRLLMVERRGCIYCEKWDAEIGPGYAASTEGQQAPLLKVDLNGTWPDGIVLGARPFLTPTFILLEHGHEQARIEGYPGDEFFYPLLGGMLRDHAAHGKAGG